jgi:benzoate-CoA ligase family protein
MADMPAPLPEQLNIADYFLGDRLADGHGAAVAVRTDAATFTYADVDRLASRYGTALRALGVRREERVFVALPDGVDFPGALFGILKLGAVAVMINPSLPTATLAALIDHCQPYAAVVHPMFTDSVDAARSQARHNVHVLVAGGALDGQAPTDRQAPTDALTSTGGRATGAGPGSGHPSLDDLASDDPLVAEPTHRDDPAIWLFSGGTTGLPKAVVQTHGSYTNSTECYAKRGLGYHAGDITVSVPKLYFGYATGSNLFFPFAVGASTALFDEHPTPEVLFDKIARHRPTVLINVPSMISKMLDHPAAAAQDLSSLRVVTSAGEALPASLYARWRETFDVELLDGLGTAEMWHVFLSNLPGAVRPGTLGKAVPGFRVEVRDDAGNPVEPGEVGSLWVSGASRALSYWRDLPRTSEVFRGAWVVTGDLVRQDADGYFIYVGRGDDALKVKGKWLVPAEVESCLASHDAVMECAVVGVSDDAGLTKPVAFVIARERRPGLDDELRQFVLSRLEPYKHPRTIVFVDDLPRTHLGKVDRGALKRRAVAT